MLLESVLAMGLIAQVSWVKVWDEGAVSYYLSDDNMQWTLLGISYWQLEETKTPFKEHFKGSLVTWNSKKTKVNLDCANMTKQVVYVGFYGKSGGKEPIIQWQDGGASSWFIEPDDILPQKLCSLVRYRQSTSTSAPGIL